MPTWLENKIWPATTSVGGKRLHNATRLWACKPSDKVCLLQGSVIQRHDDNEGFMEEGEIVEPVESDKIGDDRREFIAY